jgi:hypothetical protein
MWRQYIVLPFQIAQPAKKQVDTGPYRNGQKASRQEFLTFFILP